MSEFQRGRVTRVTFEVEYPDGSKATSVINDTQDLKMIAFSGDSVSSDATGQYNVSQEDWRQNPTMLLEYSSQREGGEASPSGSGGYILSFCSKDSHCEQ
jgi:hypothetical protein